MRDMRNIPRRIRSIVAAAITLFCSLTFPERSSAQAPIDLVIDADPGVDDAAALVWLLYQTNYPVNVRGIGTVMGNTTALNGANNILAVLDALGRRDIPVAVGASEPVSQPLDPGPWLGLRTPALLHGPDGLWQIGVYHRHRLSDFDRRDAPTLYRDLANAHPGATLLALGPLTNLAHAFSRYPDAMRLYGRIIIGAGAKYGGNRTPSAEYSLWQDPEAAHQVLSAQPGPPIIMLPLDTFQQFSMTPDEVRPLCERGRAGLRLICPALEAFVASQLTELVGRNRAWIPDVATTIFAVDSSLGSTRSGLIKVITGNGMMRGHTEIALTVLERATLIGLDNELNWLTELALLDPGNFPARLVALLSREPDNASVVVDIDEQAMHDLFQQAVTAN